MEKKETSILLFIYGKIGNASLSCIEIMFFIKNINYMRSLRWENLGNAGGHFLIHSLGMHLEKNENKTGNKTVLKKY